MRSTLKTQPALRSNSNQILFLTFFLLIQATLFGQATSNSEEKKQPKIALLGMFHFGSTSDVAAIVMEDPLGSKRQKEIKKVVEQLKAYGPTKVLVEYPISLNDSLQERYEAYLHGSFQLPVSETYQIGFRLAEALGHNKIYGMDFRLDLPFEELANYCQVNDKMEDFQEIVRIAKTLTGNMTEILKEEELSLFLKRLNDPRFDQLANELYLNQVLAIGEPGQEVGAEVNASWYKRNMIMLKNITNWITTQEERILVIVGSSHRALIKEFILNRSDLDYIEIAEYLVE